MLCDMHVFVCVLVCVIFVWHACNKCTWYLNPFKCICFVDDDDEEAEDGETEDGIAHRASDMSRMI